MAVSGMRALLVSEEVYAEKGHVWLLCENTPELQVLSRAGSERYKGGRREVKQGPT